MLLRLFLISILLTGVTYTPTPAYAMFGLEKFFGKKKKEETQQKEENQEQGVKGDQDKNTHKQEKDNPVIEHFVPAKKPPRELASGESYIGKTTEISSDYEDTLLEIARDYGLGFVELRAANPHVDPWLPGEDTKITIPARHLLPDAPTQGIVINLPEMRLYSFLDIENPKTYPIGIGREGLKTPTGTTFIASKKEGPQWRPTTRMRNDNPDLPEIVEAGPDNPLGTHALYLGWREYLIHGTAKPWGIGRRVSSGCIRMYPEDIIKVFDETPRDTPVTVVDQPIKMAWIEDELYIEAHPSIDQSQDLELEGETSFDVPQGTLKRLTDIAGKHADKIDWATIHNILSERRGYPIAVLSKNLPEKNEEILDKNKSEKIDVESEES